MPSLHLSWALLQWWHSRTLARWIQWLAFFWLIITALATLGLGLHYAIDLVVAVPFCLAVRGIAAALGGKLGKAAGRAILWGSLMTFGWLAILRFGVDILLVSPVVVWGLSIATTVASLYFEARLRRAEASPAKEPEGLLPPEPAAYPAVSGQVSLDTYIVGAVFILSGFSGLVYEVVFAKALALTFGSTATASTTVLVTYMGGIALGSWLGGWIGAGRANAMRTYAFCEIGIGLLCALSPLSLYLVQKVYIAWATGSDPASPMLTGLQVVLGSLALLPPTVLMGITLPVLARQLTDFKETLGTSVGLLYGANTLGAALGAIVTGYVLLPALGVTHTTMLAVALNLAAAFVAIQLQKRFKQPEPTHQVAAVDEIDRTDNLRDGVIAIIILTVGGIVTLALEIIYIHLLAIVAGNSAYAFSLMLFTFLIGLSGGAALARKAPRLGISVPVAIGVVEFLLAIALLAGVFLWEEIPAYFASFSGYPLAKTFLDREIIRGIVCFLVMVPPTLCIGAYYPLAMELIGQSFPNRKIQALGRAAALNTLGNIFGALLGAFILLPLLGPLKSLHILAATAVFLGLLTFMMVSARRQVNSGLLIPVVIALFMLQPGSLDYQSLSSGANVYFQAQGYGNIIDHAESMDGGLTSIAENRDEKGHRVITMLSNGKFQGDDSFSREMVAQSSFALCPMLHTTNRGKACVIGLGTGMSARVVYDAGFQHADLVELSGDVFNMAKKHFSHVNELVFAKLGVNSHITDGRNFMLLQPVKYDLITMEISSIWFAGAANLYNREFYQLAKKRLTDDGVLQQWLQLHHITMRDIISVIATIRSEFRYVWLYFVGNQGIIVATNQEMMPSHETISALDRQEGLKKILAHYGGSSEYLLKTRVLDPTAVDELLNEVKGNGVHMDDVVSTDDNLLLEYSTPKGNVFGYLQSLQANLAFLNRFTPSSITRGTLLSEKDRTISNQ